MSKKNKTTTNQTTTATMTPTNPQFTTDAISGLSGRVNDTFSKIDPYSLVAGPDALQTAAGKDAAGLSTSPNYDQASGILSGVAGAGPQHVQGASLLDNLQSYMSPYTGQVVDASLADYDFGAGKQTAQANLDLAGDTTFGGSGGSLYKSALGGELARGRGTLAAGLRDQAFNTGASLSGQDADRRQQASISNASLAEQALSRQGAAAGGLADIGSAQGADARANIDTKSSIGAILQALADAKAKAPVNALGANADILSRIPYDLFRGSDATGSLSGTSTSKTSGAGLSDWLNFFAQNASSAASAAGGG